ncbi:hypothetical protein H5410_022785 [Solanum commersonii]|uniref:Uncharacterized protein n=1 Tax=Solanum commersonii TaxID=4109 RepID=A0A9J5ZI48_SOLCO|nr:hypothetical protein H5410_022785 [Solanum commersonii]
MADPPDDCRLVSCAPMSFVDKGLESARARRLLIDKGKMLNPPGICRFEVAHAFSTSTSVASFGSSLTNKSLPKYKSKWVESNQGINTTTRSQIKAKLVDFTLLYD